MNNVSGIGKNEVIKTKLGNGEGEIVNIITYNAIKNMYFLYDYDATHQKATKTNYKNSNPTRLEQYWLNNIK